ncbi:VOC family protein [Niabella ginsengisoli]|uniref:VOC family protein n=1 Tax=Niabella ginsengisoli TaxID=522298 RepID=A0ABS9SFL4_9BACT|nr:VOC family protein [Niabella ginsengisoli]MCH5596974.1 VOC family protein [Niabella ginsengisoli]
MLRSVLLLICFSVCLSVSAQDNIKPKAVLNHQALYVVDLQKAGDFYKNIIGLEQIDEPFKIGKHIWLKTGPHTSLHLIKGAEAKKEYYKNHHICFSVPSLDAFIKILKEKKIEWEDAAGKKALLRQDQTASNNYGYRIPTDIGWK